MNSGGDNGERELGGDDLVAAEYVLGVLPAEERAQAARRIEADAEFARLVDQWELRFSPMAAGYEPLDPPAGVRAAVERRLFSSAPAGSAAPAARPSFWQSLAFWRGAAAAAVLAAAVAILVPLVGQDPAGTPEEVRLVASLAHDDTDVRYLALYEHGGSVGLSHVSGARAEGRDFELWLIEGDKAPHSLGVIPTGATVAVPITEEERARIARGAVFAISLEPAGGSPTGAPTGPVVAAGDLKSI